MDSVSNYMAMECTATGTLHSRDLRGLEMSMLGTFFVNYSAESGAYLNVGAVPVFADAEDIRYLNHLLLSPFGKGLSVVPSQVIRDYPNYDEFQLYSLRVSPVHKPFEIAVPIVLCAAVEKIPSFFKENFALLRDDSTRSPFEHCGRYVGLPTLNCGYKPSVKSLGSLEHVDTLSLGDVVEEAPCLKSVNYLIVDTDRHGLPDFLEGLSVGKCIYLKCRSNILFDMRFVNCTNIRVHGENVLLKNLELPGYNRNVTFLHTEVNNRIHSTEIICSKELFYLRNLYKSSYTDVVENFFKFKDSSLLRRAAEYRLANG